MATAIKDIQWGQRWRIPETPLQRAARAVVEGLAPVTVSPSVDEDITIFVNDAEPFHLTVPLSDWLCAVKSV